MSGARRSFKTRARQLAEQAFTPSSVSAVTGWLRNTTVGLVSSVPDVLNGSNPATASGTNRPTGNANGSMTWASPNNLAWPAVSNNSATVRFGFAGWFKCTNIAGSPILIRSTAFQLAIGGDGAIGIDVWTGIRRNGASAPGTYVAGTKAFFSLEYDGGQAAEIDKCFFRLTSSDKVALTFSVNTSMPAVTAAHGALSIGSYSTAGGQSMVGDYGKHLYAFQGAGGLSGGGLITAAQFDNLKAYEPL